MPRLHDSLPGQDSNQEEQVIWAGKSRKTVIVLGAGATRGAFSHVNVHRKRLKAPLNGDFFSVADTFARAHTAGGFRSSLLRLRKVFRSELPVRGVPTMEEAFSLLYVSKDFPEIYRSGHGRQRSAGTRREIRDFLKLAIGTLVTISRLAKNTLYDELASLVENSETVITLNYDTLLDSALATAGWNPQVGYCLSGSASKFRWKIPKSTLNVRYRGVKLLKLHGSLNWFARGSYRQLGRVFDSKPTRIADPARMNEMNGFIRQIVPPIYGKFFAHKHWQQIWTRAYEDLLQAETIVVVGCSLVDTDFHLRALFGRVVANRRSKDRPLAHAVFVDRTRVRRKWRRLFGSLVQRTESFGTFKKFMIAARR